MVSDDGLEQVGREVQATETHYGIYHHTVAGEAPWQNGMTERHGGTLKRMLVRTIAESDRASCLDFTPSDSGSKVRSY